MASKVVQAKEEPVTIIAVDNTICRVSKKRFSEIIVGDQISCIWQAR